MKLIMTLTASKAASPEEEKLLANVFAFQVSDILRSAIAEVEVDLTDFPYVPYTKENVNESLKRLAESYVRWLGVRPAALSAALGTLLEDNSIPPTITPVD